MHVFVRRVPLNLTGHEPGTHLYIEKFLKINTVRDGRRNVTDSHAQTHRMIDDTDDDDDEEEEDEDDGEGDTEDETRLERIHDALRWRRTAMTSMMTSSSSSSSSRGVVETAKRAARRGRRMAREAGREATRAMETVETMRRAREEAVRARIEAEEVESGRLEELGARAREACETLREEIERGKRRADSLRKTLDAGVKRAEEVEQACENVKTALVVEKEEAKRMEGELGRLRAEGDAAFDALARQRARLTEISSRSEALRGADDEAEMTVRREEREHAKIASRNAELGAKIAAAARALKDSEALLENEIVTREQLEAESVRHEIDRRGSEKALSRLRKQVSRKERANARLEAQLNQVEKASAGARETAREHDKVKALLDGELSQVTHEIKRTIEEYRALKIEVNDRRERCKEEITKRDALAQTVSVTLREEIAELEDEVKCLRAEEVARNRIKSHVTDRVSRELRRSQRVKANVRELKSFLGVREAEIEDVQEHIRDARERQGHFEQLSDLTRLQRDAFAGTLRKCVAITENITEKSKQFDSKNVNLEREMQEKESGVRAARAETDVKKRRRDEQRSRNDGVSQAIVQTRADADVGDTEMSKLKASIKIEKSEHARILTQSQDSIKSREAVALELLDRNAELCELCDRVATSEVVSQQCEEELAACVHECEILRRKVHDVERSLGIARGKVGAIPNIEAEVATKRAQLCELQNSAEDLCEKLEDPRERKKWRIIHGPKGREDPCNSDVLQGKLEQLHARLEEKERELAIRALKCRDVDEETIHLQEKISQNSDEALDTASSLNRAKFKLSSIERAMLAVVSELAMYRALTATLANAKSRNIAEIDALRLTLEAKET